jgi:hypothetical protein
VLVERHHRPGWYQIGQGMVSTIHPNRESSVRQRTHHHGSTYDDVVRGWSPVSIAVADIRGKTAFPILEAGGVPEEGAERIVVLLTHGDLNNDYISLAKGLNCAWLIRAYPGSGALLLVRREGS